MLNKISCIVVCLIARCRWRRTVMNFLLGSSKQAQVCIVYFGVVKDRLVQSLLNSF